MEMAFLDVSVASGGLRAARRLTAASAAPTVTSPPASVAGVGPNPIPSTPDSPPDWLQVPYSGVEPYVSAGAGSSPAAWSMMKPAANGSISCSMRGALRAEKLPQKRGDPELGCQDDPFWRIFAACLPPRQGQIFMMREFRGLEPDEMCKVLGISQTDLNGTLHPARLRLCECLENRWFREVRPC